MSRESDLHYDRYPIEDEEEWLMRIGAADRRPILFLPPLFEEMNRTRWLLAEVMRHLADGGYGCWLPDLPGTGESERRLEDCRWQDWRSAARDAGAHVSRITGMDPVVAGIRGGCLLDDCVAASCHWRFAPVEGASLARDLVRSSLVGTAEQSGEIVDYAGYAVDQRLLAELREAGPGTVTPLRTVRLESDRGDADAKTAGPSLWRRSEPGTSPELAGFIAADIGLWSSQCAGF